MTASKSPPDSCCAATANSVDAGLPILIAVATVSGFVTGRPSTKGAAPLAWKAHIRGRRELSFASAYWV